MFLARLLTAATIVGLSGCASFSVDNLYKPSAADLYKPGFGLNAPPPVALYPPYASWDSQSFKAADPTCIGSNYSCSSRQQQQWNNASFLP
jgi:hypothetical protein